MAREEAAQEQLREGERAYDAAEARKGVLLQQETAAWDPNHSPSPNPNPSPSPSPNPNPNPSPCVP